jgi:hypothetical protein
LRGDAGKLFDGNSTGLLFVLGELMALAVAIFLPSSSVSLSRSLEACCSSPSSSKLKSSSSSFLDFWNAALLGSLCCDSGFLRSSIDLSAPSFKK